MQDRGTYYRLGLEVPTGRVVLTKLVDGQASEVLGVTVSGLVFTQQQNWRVKLSGGDEGVPGDDLDVWMQVNGQGAWQHVISSTGNGANKVGEIRSGHAGISAACRCEYFKIGYNITSADGALDQVVFADDFGASTPGLSVTLQYDAAGNMTGDGLYTYTYDAWNRLVEVKRKVVSGTAPTIATYRYDGLGRRIYKKVEHSGDRDRTEFFYYNSRWQLLEIRNQEDKATRQFVWGTQYIDEAICMDVDTDTSGEGYGNCTDAGSKRYFYCQDANWNVIALREGSTIVERYEYDPYGECRVLKGYTSAENQEDLTVTGDSLAGNPIRYAGYFFDNETQRYQVRNRYLDPRLGRWNQEDPLEYLDRMNLYQYAANCPTGATDAQGLWGHRMHYRSTYDEAWNAGMNTACCTLLARGNMSVDDFTGAALFPQYHFELQLLVENNQVVRRAFPCGRDCWYGRRWTAATAMLQATMRWERVVQGLWMAGQALHSLQDGSSHQEGGQPALPKADWLTGQQLPGAGQGHMAQTDFDHAPSVICLLPRSYNDPVQEECRWARENNPNWYDPHRPDDRDRFPEDFWATALDTRTHARLLMLIPSVQCHCSRGED